MMDAFSNLKNLTTFNPFFYPHSRSHLLNLSFPDSQCFIKREDELGGVFNGSKIRKYYALIPFLVKNHIETVLIKGGAYSNAIAALVPLLIENRIKPVLFLRGEPDSIKEGNLFYLHLFKKACEIHWVDRTHWPRVDQDILNHQQCLTEKTMILPEGASCSESFPGALTLAINVVQNQQELGISFDHIFVESGTGMTAIALILGLQYLKSPAIVHVLDLTRQGALFTDFLHHLYQGFTAFISNTSGDILDAPLADNYRLYAPTLGSSFGVVNTKIVEKILNFAYSEGIILDPIYAAPLFLETCEYIQKNNLKGNFLFIHNGGTLALEGYKHKFHF